MSTSDVSPRLRAVPPLELPDRARVQVERAACRILSRLEPGTVWTPADHSVELDTAA